MNHDDDLQKRILARVKKIEGTGRPIGSDDMAEEWNVGHRAVSNQCSLLSGKGLIKANRTGISGGPDFYVIGGLTPEGHERLKELSHWITWSKFERLVERMETVKSFVSIIAYFLGLITGLLAGWFTWG